MRDPRNVRRILARSGTLVGANPDSLRAQASSAVQLSQSVDVNEYVTAPGEGVICRGQPPPGTGKPIAARPSARRPAYRSPIPGTALVNAGHLPPPDIYPRQLTITLNPNRHITLTHYFSVFGLAP